MDIIDCHPPTALINTVYKARAVPFRARPILFLWNKARAVLPFHKNLMESWAFMIMLKGKVFVSRHVEADRATCTPEISRSQNVHLIRI